MRRWIPLLMLAGLTGCNQPKHVSGPEFKRELDLRHTQTMVFSEYLGEKDGKVFLKRKTMSLASKEKWNKEVWYTETNNLDATILNQLNNVKAPNEASSNKTN